MQRDCDRVIHPSNKTQWLAIMVGYLAYKALCLEVRTFPKPGLVSHRDNGAHRDMDCTLLEKSAATLEPFFRRFYQAGRLNATMDELRYIGLQAEKTMLHATGGINTHRGAIFSMGLISAAYGWRQRYLKKQRRLGSIIAERWGKAIIDGPVIATSHGHQAARKYGAGGARLEAACGFPTIYDIGLPELEKARYLNDCPEAQRVHVTMALLTQMEDTNLLHRGGLEGMQFAQNSAQAFLKNGSIGVKDWLDSAQKIHRIFIARNLSPGGVADMLAATLFINFLEKA